MFFRREKPRQWTFEDRIANLKQFGFDSIRQSASQVRVTRKGCGAILEDQSGGAVKIGKAGIIIGDEIGTLVSAGYEMFLRTPTGVEAPALAPQLKALHAFDEDLREGLGLTSLYNVSLGTTSAAHLYDRVLDRDVPKHARPWER